MRSGGSYPVNWATLYARSNNIIPSPRSKGLVVDPLIHRSMAHKKIKRDRERKRDAGVSPISLIFRLKKRKKTKKRQETKQKRKDKKRKSVQLSVARRARYRGRKSYRGREGGWEQVSPLTGSRFRDRLVFVGIYGASVASLHNPVRTDPDRRARIKFHRALLSAPIFILRHVFVSQ